MKRTFYLLALLAFFVSCKETPSVITVDYIPQWDTIRVLENPHKGWYQHFYDNQIVKYKVQDKELFRNFPGMDHLYLRLAWSFLEPEEGKYNWALIDNIINEYVPEGYGISFSITSKETGKYPIVVGQQKNGVQYATPVWVEKAGAKGVVTEAEGARSWSPQWDDPVYLEKLDNFHRAFAQKYDGKPWVRYVDIGSIGEWGEGHTSRSTQIPPTVKEVKENMDVYLKNYKHSLLVATDDLLYYGKPEVETQELYKYAVENGMTIRDDSPLVDYYLDCYPDSWSVSHPGFYDPLYKTKPTILEMQHYSMIKNDGNWKGKNGSEIIPKYGHSAAEMLTGAIETMHATYIGFHGFVEEWYTENPDLACTLANKCGYWYFPVSCNYSPNMKKGENKLTICWTNKGVAPAYNVYSLLLQFTHTQTGEKQEVIINDSGNMGWLPGKEYYKEYTFTIPKDWKQGIYEVRFGLFHKDGKIDIGVSPTIQEEGYTQIGNIKLG